MKGKRLSYGAVLWAISAGMFFALGVGAQAASPTGPQFLITWRALSSYAPSSYNAKVLPNQTSPIMASLEIISQGRQVNLAGQIIYWYLNDNLLGGGAGVQRITFQPYGTAPNTLALKVDLPNYPGGPLVHEISVPVVQPQAVIEASYPQGVAPVSPIIAQALPYFFNATSVSPLSFAWTVNGQVVSNAENPQTLQISLPQSTPPGYGLGVTLTIKNSNDASSATGNASLTYQK